MTQADFLDKTQDRSAKKYCRSCWRDDFHVEVISSSVVYGFLVFATFGLVLLARPTRCVCCGTIRIF